MTFNPQREHNPPKDAESFEMLCCDLWKVIWDDPNAQRVGRRGQSQNGVDIVGQPHGDTQMVGVQCKCKERFTAQQVSEAELRKEVEKAKGFRPPLKSFILATTAPRHSPIQEVARDLTQQHRAVGLFGVYVCAWQDIDELLVAHRPPLARQMYDDLADDPALRQIEKKLDLIILSTLGGGASEGRSSPTEMAFRESLDEAVSPNKDRLLPRTQWRESRGGDPGKNEDGQRASKPGVDLSADACERNGSVLIIEETLPADPASAGDILLVVSCIRSELARWNYDRAAKLACVVETEIASGVSIDRLVIPSILALLARIRLNQAETGPGQRDLEGTLSLLVRAEKMLAGDADQLAEVTALKASFEHLQNGPDAAMVQLEGRTDPYAIRTRTVLLMNQQMFAEALTVLSRGWSRTNGGAMWR